MKNISAIRINDYDYDLPCEKIALYPLDKRDSSKLLVWRDGEMEESGFSEIGDFIPDNSLLVFNNTRVIHARLFFRRETGAHIEIFCLEPHEPADYQLSFQKSGSVVWKCLVGNAKKWKSGDLQLQTCINGETVICKAQMLERTNNAFLIRFSWGGEFTFADVVEAAGQIPIPPYLNRDANSSDNDRYQTVYAKINGSVAAPTAGLHFTEEIFEKLRKKKVAFSELTLHVGAGTFQPVKTENVADHQMHTETVVVSREFLGQLKGQCKVIAVGTTSVRSIESLYWLGLKINNLSASETLHVGQWEAYEPQSEIEKNRSLANIERWLESNKLQQISFSTSIIVAPGYRFRIIDGMITNFHQPKSTLLLLVSAFIGNDWKKAYEYALKNDFRFLSYGDSNIYLKTR
ncbi:MAG: S-adenosylmethionine:tRNA ribosyltransferase-isomerase [Prolixibacteraceae bacterium]|nr:S-adenosylmethionine:tRNA ribosyltransferase-isomerase [Prolixibacteraceae bacterium]